MEPLHTWLKDIFGNHSAQTAIKVTDQGKLQTIFYTWKKPTCRIDSRLALIPL